MIELTRESIEIKDPEVLKNVSEGLTNESKRRSEYLMREIRSCLLQELAIKIQLRKLSEEWEESLHYDLREIVDKVLTKAVDAYLDRHIATVQFYANVSNNRYAASAKVELK